MPYFLYVLQNSLLFIYDVSLLIENGLIHEFSLFRFYGWEYSGNPNDDVSYWRPKRPCHLILGRLHWQNVFQIWARVSVLLKTEISECHTALNFPTHLAVQWKKLSSLNLAVKAAKKKINSVQFEDWGFQLEHCRNRGIESSTFHSPNPSLSFQTTRKTCHWLSQNETIIIFHCFKRIAIFEKRR